MVIGVLGKIGMGVPDIKVCAGGIGGYMQIPLPWGVSIGETKT
jgi:hypothetical protein